MLAFYCAKHFDGKMILRFDYKNSSKEKGEYLESIKAHIKRLEIIPDQITYSSAHFAKLRELMATLIKEENAYCDNIEPEKKKEERMKGIKNAKRDTSVEENLKIWGRCRGKILPKK